MQHNPKERKRSKGARRRLKLMLFAVLCVGVWAGVTIVDQMGKFKEKTAQLDQLEKKLEDTKKKNEEMKKDVSRLSDKEYLGEIIRKDFGYMKKGETVFDLPKANP
jgi:cell division protein DivIC